MNEAGDVLDEGAAVDAIDRALVEFGFPVGPITLLDEVGIDVGGKSGEIIADAFGARMAPAASLQRVVAAGRSGRKGGRASTSTIRRARSREWTRPSMGYSRPGRSEAS